MHPTARRRLAPAVERVKTGRACVMQDTRDWIARPASATPPAWVRAPPPPPVLPTRRSGKSEEVAGGLQFA